MAVPFDDTPDVLPRWAMDAAGTSAPDVEQPTSQKRDAGWLLGEKPARGIVNWLQQTVYLWIGHFLNLLSRWFGEDQVLPAGGSNELAPTLTRLGSGPYTWRFNAAAGVIWSGGKAYALDAANIVVDPAGDPDTYRLLVATPTGLAVRESAYPGAEPTLTAGDVPLALAIIGASTTSTTLIDRRDVGRWEGSYAEVSRVFRAGAGAGGTWGLEVLKETAEVFMSWGTTRMGFITGTDWLVTVDQPAGKVTLKGAVDLVLAERAMTFPGAAFVATGVTGVVTGTAGFSPGSLTFDGTGTGTCYLPLHLPHGCTITGLEAWANDAGAGIAVEVRLMRHTLGVAGTGYSNSTLATVSLSGSGNLNGSDTSISTPAVDTSLYAYFLEANGDAATTDTALKAVSVSFSPGEL